MCLITKHFFSSKSLIWIKIALCDQYTIKWSHFDIVEHLDNKMVHANHKENRQILQKVKQIRHFQIKNFTILTVLDTRSVNLKKSFLLHKPLPDLSIFLWNDNKD